MQNRILNYLSLLVFVGFLFLVGSSYQPVEPPSGTNLFFLDVGQGDSALVTMSKDRQILIDGGPGKSVLEEVGKIMPYYDRKIEYLILSHPHADHLAGFNYILDRYEIEKIYLNGYKNNTPDYQLFEQKIKEKSIPVQVLKRGDLVDFVDVKIDVLWPDKNKISSADINDTSLIFYLYKENNDILFTGDASSSVQEKIVKDLRETDVLKVSHHGSKTGTTQKLVDKLKPKYSIISVGKNNRFHHPAPSIVSLLHFSRVLRTDLDGTVKFELSDGGVVLK